MAITALSASVARSSRADAATGWCAKRPYNLRQAGISFWLASGVDPAECARRAGQSIQVLFRYYAKFLAEARNHANRLIEESMQRWEAPMGDAEGDLAGPWPGNAPELLVRAGIPVGDIGSKGASRLTASPHAAKGA